MNKGYNDDKPRTMVFRGKKLNTSNIKSIELMESRDIYPVLRNWTVVGNIYTKLQPLQAFLLTAPKVEIKHIYISDIWLKIKIETDGTQKKIDDTSLLPF